jgi:prepilin peptidase dependent protein B
LTLTGLMVGMSVGVLVLSATSAVYLLTIRSAAENLRSTRLNQELRAVIEIMQLDIRRAGYWAFPDTADPADPADNPFQSTIRGIDNDLRTGNIGAEPTNSCLTYSYDLNANSTIGVCHGCTTAGGPFDSAPYDRSNVEMFGFRLRDGAIQMRTRRASGSEVTFGCNSGFWETITSDDVHVDLLRFVVTTRATNLNADKTSTVGCETGDLCRQMRTVDVRMTGRLAEDTDVRQTLTARVGIRNDRYSVH